MAQENKILSQDAIQFLCGLMRDLACVSDGIDDVHPSTISTYSSVYIDSLIASAKQSANQYTDQICNALKRITGEITTTQPTLENTTVNVLYLYSADGNAPFEQYLKLSETTLVPMGSTSIAMNDYYTKTQADNLFATKTDLQGVSNSIGDETLDTTAVTVKGAINEVNAKAHEHSNAEYIAKVGEDSDGKLTYGGNPVSVDIDVDTAMSNTSTNPVQNKVVKAYIDSHSGGGGSVIVDDEMSDISENPVQNKVVKEYVDNHTSSFEISEEEGNALEMKEDGAFVQDYTSDIEELNGEIASLDARSVIGSSLSTANIKLSEERFNITSFINQIIPYDIIDNQSEFIKLNADGSITLTVGHKYLLMPSFYLLGGYAEIAIVKKTDNSILQSCLPLPVNTNDSGSGMPVIPYIYSVNSPNDSVICVSPKVISGNATILSAYSNFIIAEIGRTAILDPLEEAQGHEIEEVLFENATPQTSGIVTLSKDFSEFDYLYFEIGTIGGGGFTVNTTNEIKTDRLVTSSSNNVINLHGWDDCYIEIYKNNNTSITITASKTYGIARIIGKKSKNPVLLNYTANYGDFDKTTLFEGEANLVGTYNLSDSISNYKQLYILIRLNTPTGSLRNDTMVIDTDDINTTYTGDAYSRSFSTSGSNSRYIGFNFSAGLNKIVVNTAGNATNTNVAIIKIVGIKGHINP